MHRDLKPQNVKLTPGGRVKVLDFGLAKALDPAAAALGRRPTWRYSPTLTFAGTVQGMMIGTAAYMSPEQARGREVDKRADIWSFGVVLYEMLAGGRLFEGESAADTLSGVLRQAIDLAALPARHPATVRDCSGAAWCATRGSGCATSARRGSPWSGPPRLERGPEAAALRPRPLPRAAGRGGRWSRSRSRRVWRSARAVAAWLRPTPVFEPIRIHALTFSGADAEPAASPDGKLVAFTSWRDGISRIWIKQLEGGGEAPFTAGPDRYPRFSPDGSGILFLRDRGGAQASTGSISWAASSASWSTT